MRKKRKLMKMKNKKIEELIEMLFNTNKREKYSQDKETSLEYFYFFIYFNN